MSEGASQRKKIRAIVRSAHRKDRKNELQDAYISEFNSNYEIIRNIKSKRIDITKKEWVIENAEIYVQNNKIETKKLYLKTNYNYEINNYHLHL